MKTCSRCKQQKPFGDFCYKPSIGRHTAYCRPCASEYNAEWQRANPDKVRLRARKHQLKKKFGLTLDDWETMLEAQGGVCAICKNPETLNKRLAVDHDHNTGEIRGLLCHRCNVAIGFMAESPERIQMVLDYLNKRLTKLEDE